LGVKPPTIRIPLAPVLWMASLCEFVFTPFGIEPPLHRRRVSFFQNNRAFSINKAKKVLGFQPQVSLREAIRRTIRWYRENGYL
jgi:dihydroflavonol-4-reductase